MTAAPLQRMPGEPTYWFRRFLRYVSRGPGRAVLSIYADERAERLGPDAPRPSQVPGAWKRAVRRWEWRERAAEWDGVQARAAFAAYERRCREAFEPKPTPETVEERLCRLILGAVEAYVEAGGSLRPVDSSRVLRASVYLLTASEVRGSGRRWTARAARVLSGVRLGHTRRKPSARLGEVVGASGGVPVTSDNI